MTIPTHLGMHSRPQQPAEGRLSHPCRAEEMQQIITGRSHPPATQDRKLQEWNLNINLEGVFLEACILSLRKSREDRRCMSLSISPNPQNEWSTPRRNSRVNSGLGDMKIRPCSFVRCNKCPARIWATDCGGDVPVGHRVYKNHPHVPCKFAMHLETL